MENSERCYDCDATSDLEACTICCEKVCPAHRAGTGRLRDGYQCMVRNCWAVRAERALRGLNVEELSKSLLPMADQKLPPPKFTYVAPWPLTLTHVGLDPGIPVDPPLELKGGQSVVLWWVMEAGKLRYCHAGSGRA